MKMMLSPACLSICLASTPGEGLQPLRFPEPLASLSLVEQDRFDFGRLQYIRQFDVASGLGPTVNNDSCGLCHAHPLGGWGMQRVTRFGFMDEMGEFMPLDPLGDTLWQHVLVVDGEDCAEEIPAEVNHSARRITLGSGGFGLIEAIPSEQILKVQSTQTPGIQGIVHWVDSIEDSHGSPPRIGRFGWKAQEATILAFSAKAASDEMGITTWLVQQEPPPNGDVDQLLQCDDVPDPETGIDVEGFDYLSAITDFQRFMAPPPRAPASGMRGELIMDQIGCSSCHVPAFTTSVSQDLEEALRGKMIQPYSDFLLHDMGAAGDGIEEGEAQEWWMKTTPLWGLAAQPASWHDGRCSEEEIHDRLLCAITQHGASGSQAVASVEAFESLSPDSRNDLLNFLASLGRRPFDVDRDAHIGRYDFTSPSDGFSTCYGKPVAPDDPCAIHDHDSDGMIGIADLNSLALAWDDLKTDCNENGQWDIEDLILGSSPDVDGNGIPDECTICPGDLDLDGKVDVDDLLVLISIEWGCSSGCLGDLDSSGSVDAVDVLYLIALWGSC
ncbi:MAG: hypothetical protein CMJ40_06905 [Phycisphaerae bacterium]|nr:hypothetical protein [Phycisphaerae bacterium]|tara:strand:- start:1471 stop:3135 length:1665 start_codon:yes stop_codon:yes gene_type:complete